MKFTNACGQAAGWTLAFEGDGREMLVVVAKATYGLPPTGEAPRLADEQVPLVEADRFSGEPGLSAPMFETDYAHRKPGCDVLLIGSAHVPQGRQATRIEVGLRVGPMVKQFAVVGERHWQRRVLGIATSAPLPFSTLPISYDCAFGGTDRTQEKNGQTDAYLANPVGRGYWRHTDAIDGSPLPNTEALDEPIASYSGKYRPMALSPIGRNWAPRVDHAGTYDQSWIENTAPFWPADFDPRYFQAAPPDQVIPYLRGGEEIVLRNLTPDGHRSFQLPTRALPITFIPHVGRDLTLRAQLDTIVLEPDAQRFTLAWRANLPLARSVFDVREAIVGEMSAAWHRARRFPGKTYYASLRELVAEQRGGRA